MRHPTLYEIMNMSDKERKDLEWRYMDPKPVTLYIDGQIIKRRRKLRNPRKEGGRTVCDVTYKGKTYTVRFVYGFNWTNLPFK